MKSLIVFSILAISSLSYPLINALPLKASPDVVRIIFHNQWMCTGVFLDEATVLTAAHCIPPSNDKHRGVDLFFSDSDRLLEVTQIESFVHPEFKAQAWHSFDVAIIKTTRNKNFKADFKLEKNSVASFGEAALFGCGKSDLAQNTRARTTGANSFLRIGSILFFIGKSSNTESSLGVRVSIAPNDSGGPIIDKHSGRIIGIATTTTVKQSAQYGVLTLSTGTSTLSTANLEFILRHLKTGEAF